MIRPLSYIIDIVYSNFFKYIINFIKYYNLILFPGKLQVPCIQQITIL